MPYFEHLLHTAFQKVTDASRDHAISAASSSSQNAFAIQQVQLIEEALQALLSMETQETDWDTYRDRIAVIITQTKHKGELLLAKSSETDISVDSLILFGRSILNMYKMLDELFINKPVYAPHRNTDASIYTDESSPFNQLLDITLRYKIDKFILNKIKQNDKEASQTSEYKYATVYKILVSWDDLLRKTEKPRTEEQKISLHEQVTSLIAKLKTEEDELQYQSRKGPMQYFFRKGFTAIGKGLGYDVGGALNDMLAPFFKHMETSGRYEWEALPEIEIPVMHELPDLPSVRQSPTP